MLKTSDEDDDNDDYDDDYDNRTTLHEVWKQQSRLNANDIVSRLTHTDAYSVGMGLNCPVINVKYTDTTGDYVPNSNLYGQEWFEEAAIDSDYERHLLLVRHLGLVTISMSEREIVEYGVEHYMSRLDDYLRYWYHHADPKDLAARVETSLFSGWQVAQQFTNTDSVTVDDLYQELKKLTAKTIKTGAEIDAVSDEALQGVRTDYAWYRYHKKLLHYAQFKTSNYRLLRIEQGFKLDDRDRHYLQGQAVTAWDHLVYAPGPQAFPGLWQARGAGDAVARWLVVIYDKMYRYHDYRVI